MKEVKKNLQTRIILWNLIIRMSIILKLLKIGWNHYFAKNKSCIIRFRFWVLCAQRIGKFKSCKWRCWGCKAVGSPNFKSLWIIYLNVTTHRHGITEWIIWSFLPFLITFNRFWFTQKISNKLKTYLSLFIDVFYFEICENFRLDHLLGASRTECSGINGRKKGGPRHMFPIKATYRSK